jgi:hypothetical protein
MHSARLVLHSVDFAEIEVLQRAGAGMRRAPSSPMPLAASRQRAPRRS